MMHSKYHDVFFHVYFFLHYVYVSPAYFCCFCSSSISFSRRIALTHTLQIVGPHRSKIHAVCMLPSTRTVLSSNTTPFACFCRLPGASVLSLLLLVRASKPWSSSSESCRFTAVTDRPGIHHMYENNSATTSNTHTYTDIFVRANTYSTDIFVRANTP
jgi:hypothetical protein